MTFQNPLYADPCMHDILPHVVIHDGAWTFLALRWGISAMRIPTTVLLSAASLALMPMAAQAYIGPGLGAGAVAAVLGVLGSLVLMIIAIVYYPIKRLLKRGHPTRRLVARSRK